MTKVRTKEPFTLNLHRVPSWTVTTSETYEVRAKASGELLINIPLNLWCNVPPEREYLLKTVQESDIDEPQDELSLNEMWETLNSLDYNIGDVTNMYAEWIYLNQK